MEGAFFVFFLAFFGFLFFLVGVLYIYCKYDGGFWIEFSICCEERMRFLSRVFLEWDGVKRDRVF